MIDLVTLKRDFIDSDIAYQVLGKRDDCAIWTPREVKYYAAASGYICYLDLGYRTKPCQITA